MMIVAAALPMFGFAAAIENVIALQRPGTGIVDIYYDLIINEGGTTTVSALVEGGDGEVRMETLSGDIGHVVPGPARHIVWNAQADNPEQVISDIRVGVIATNMDSVENAGMKRINGSYRCKVQSYIYCGGFGGNNGNVWGGAWKSTISDSNYSFSGDRVFYIDRAPVSGALWNKVALWGAKHGYSLTTYSSSTGVVYPSYVQALNWCNARSAMEGLPTRYNRIGSSSSRQDSCDYNAGYRLPGSSELIAAFCAGVSCKGSGTIQETYTGMGEWGAYMGRYADGHAVTRVSNGTYDYEIPLGASGSYPLYCVRDERYSSAIVETFPPNYSSAFTIDTRVNSPTFPKDFKIINVKSKYCDGKYGSGNKALFLSDVSYNVEFEAEVYGGELAYLERVDNEDAPAVGEQISLEDGKFSLDVGAFSPGDSFVVRARSVDGRYSRTFHLNFDIASQNGDRFGIAETQPADRDGHCSLIYRTVDVSTMNLFDDLNEEAMHGSSQGSKNNTTAFTDKLRSIRLSVAIDLYKRMDSSEGIIRSVALKGFDLTKLTGAQLEKIEKGKFQDVEFMKLGAWGIGAQIGSEEMWLWDNNRLEWNETDGFALLNLSAKLKLFQAWYGPASVSLNAGANGMFKFHNVDNRFEGGFETDELVYLKGTLGVGVPVVGALEGSLTGGIFVKAGSMYDPYWNELGLQIRWDAQWRLLVWSGDILPKHMPHTLVKWWWVGGDGSVVLNDPDVLIDTAIADAIANDSATNLTSRAYADHASGASGVNGDGPYSGFTKTTVNPYPTSGTPVDIETDGMPGPTPQASGDTPPSGGSGIDGTGGNGNSPKKPTSKIVTVADNSNRTPRRRATVITISDNTNTTFKVDGAVWDDGTPDYGPVAACLTNGSSVVAWMNEKAGKLENISLGEMMSAMEIAAAVWNDEVGEWSHQNLTDNDAYDRSPVLKTATNGTAAVAWLRNAHTNYIGSASKPNQVCFARYADGAWTSESVVVPSIGRVRKLDMAYDGNRAAIVFNEEDDPGSGTTQRLYVVEGDCTTWEQPRIAAEFPANGSAAYAYYDESGDLRFVWNDEGAVKTGCCANGVVSTETIDTDGHLVPGDYVFTRAHSGRMALVWLEPMREGDSAMGPVSMTYNPSCGIWTLPCALTSDGKNKAEVSAAFNDSGDLEVFYATPNVATNGEGVVETVSSGFSKVTRWHGGDAAILLDDVSFSTNQFVTGETVDVMFKVKNFGDGIVSNMMVGVYDGNSGFRPMTNIVCIAGLQDGQIITPYSSYIRINVLQVGQCLEFKVPWTIPDSVSSQLILEFMVYGIGDVWPQNNYPTFQYGSADVSFVKSQSRGDEISQSVRHVSVSLENNGLAAVPAGTEITFRRGSAQGAVLARKTVGKLLTGEDCAQTIGFAWDISSLVPTSKVEVVHVTAKLPESAVVEQNVLEVDIPVDVAPMEKSPLTSYSLKYVANGGSGTMSAEQPFYDEWNPFASNAFVRAGYSFAGWALSPTGDVVYADGAVHQNIPMYSRDTATLYAVWNRVAEETSTTDVPVPFAWLGGYFPEATNSTDSLEQQIANFESIANRLTGKRDGNGNPLSVWHDYVVGTNPTNRADVFRASITFDKDTNAPVIEWMPKLSEEEAAKRIYRKYGKRQLSDEWTPIDGDTSNYNFFMVTVEMR